MTLHSIGLSEEVQHYCDLKHLKQYFVLLIISSKRDLLTFVTSGIFFICTFLIIPLPTFFHVCVDLHTKLCAVIVVGLIFCPWVVTNPRAVVSSPGPALILVISCDSNPKVWTAGLAWKHWNQVVVLLLALDNHQVCVFGLAPLSSLGPVHWKGWAMICPAQSSLSQKAP